MRPRLLACLSPLAVLAAFAACSSDDDPVTTSSADAGRDAPADVAATEDAGHAGHDDAGGGDAGPPPIRCTEAELAAGDFTDGGTLEIAFEQGANPKQYTNACATVKAGASVTFTGSFTQHPLEPAGGDTPNPIPYTPEDRPNDRLVVTFPNAGTFGYRCEFHPTLMYGAIRVVP